MERKIVSFFCWSSNDGQYLYSGDCFEEELFHQYEKCLKSDSLKNDKWLLLLTNEISECDKATHTQDILYDFFRDNIEIDYSFAEKLNLFDILKAECFVPKNEIGDAIIQLCVLCDMDFIVSKKIYLSMAEIDLDFEVCNCDSRNDCHRALINQTIPS